MPKIILADNLKVMPTLEEASVDLIYMDPPFNTGRRVERTRLRVVRDEENGDRKGFAGRRYRSERLGSSAYRDRFDDYAAFLAPRLEESWRLLKEEGSLFIHLDYREVHYIKVLCDTLFGRRCFRNEIIWAYDYGARSKRRWSPKHDTLLWYVRNPSRYTFNYAEIDRIPYMAPRLAGPEKAARGKTPTDVWWHTIVPTSGNEKTGYPTQKPLGLLKRVVRVHSRPGDLLLDPFAGSGTFGEAALRLGRDAILIDNNREAVRVMARRLAFAEPECVGFRPAKRGTSAETGRGAEGRR